MSHLAVAATMQPLRQITNARGMTTEPDGTVTVELIGPLVYERNVTGH